MGTAKLSPDQSAILERARADGSFRCTEHRERVKCRALNAKGMLRRDLKDADLWYPADAGSTHAPAVVEPRGGVPEIVSMLQKAVRLFDEGDVQKARVIADGAYDLSQAEARFAAKYAATRELVPKFRQLQGDALLLETRCKIELAKAYDAAQKAGTAAGRGRPKNVATDDIFKQSEAGLTRQEIHDARKLAAAEEKEPGIAERAIAARIAQGLAPTRANLKHAIGTRSATKAERGDNLYETPVEGTWTILALEDFSPTIEEPFCGRGAIARVLEAAGHEVLLSDINDYGTATRDGVCQEVVDFKLTAGITGNDIVSNPPYGEEMNACIAHALRVRRPRKMALLLNLNVLAGYEDPDRTFYMEECPPARIYVNKHRLTMMHRDGWDGNKASSQMNTMWCVWEMQEDGTYGNTTVLRRVDWADYRPDVPAESEAA